MASTDAEREALHRELDDYLTATTELRASLLEVQNRIRRMKGLIEEGAGIGAFLSSFSEPGEISRGLTEHIDTLELERRRTRRQIVLITCQRLLNEFAWLGEGRSSWRTPDRRVGEIPRHPTALCQDTRLRVGFHDSRRSQRVPGVSGST